MCIWLGFESSEYQDIYNPQLRQLLVGDFETMTVKQITLVSQTHFQKFTSEFYSSLHKNSSGGLQAVFSFSLKAVYYIPAMQIYFLQALFKLH